MRKLFPYYLSRLFLAGTVGTFFVLTGSPWWVGVLITAGLGALFIWAARSGRYLIRAEGGIAPLRRDELSQSINARAARNALVVGGLTLGATALLVTLRGGEEVSVSVLTSILSVTMLAYLVSDVWLRRR